MFEIVGRGRSDISKLRGRRGPRSMARSASSHAHSSLLGVTIGNSCGLVEAGCGTENSALDRLSALRWGGSAHVLCDNKSCGSPGDESACKLESVMRCYGQLVQSRCVVGRRCLNVLSGSMPTTKSSIT